MVAQTSMIPRVVIADITTAPVSYNSHISYNANIFYNQPESTNGLLTPRIIRSAVADPRIISAATMKAR